MTAGAPTGLMVTASGSTTVGFQVFANVNLTGAASPTGTMSFVLYGAGDSGCAAAPAFSSTVAVAGTSVNSAHYTTTLAGTYRWRVSYSGDANNAAAGPTPCANASASVTVGQAYTALSLTALAPVASTIRASATVIGYSPTGLVTFSLSAPGDTFCSITVFTSTVALSNGAATSAPYTAPTGGQYKWRATYSGDVNNQYDPVTACLDPNAAVTVAAPAAGFVYPLDRQANVDTSKPFTWQASSGAQGYRLTIGTAAGASDLVSTAVLAATQTSYQVPPLPSGQSLYATLYTQANGTWTNQGITFTAAPAWSTFTYPLDGQTNVDTTVAFSWQPRPQAQGFFLTVGTTYGGYDLLWSGTLPATQTSYNVPALPAGTLYALLYTDIGGTWYGQAITITANATEAALTTPGNNQVGVDPNTTFRWSTVAGAQSYTLWIGTTYVGHDLVATGPLPTSQNSYTTPTLPAGTLVFATLFTLQADGTTTGQAIYFTTSATAGSGGSLGATASPSSGLPALAALPAAPQ